MRPHPPPMRHPALLALALLTVLVPVSLQGTTLLYKGFDDLVLEADAVIVGTVAAVESMPSPNDEIYTFVTLDQIEALQGQPEGSEVVLRLFGGAFGEDVIEVQGAPVFTEGDQVLLFLQGNTQEMVPLVGWTQGIFRPCFDPGSNLEVTCDYAGNRVFDITGNTVIKESVYFPDAEIVELGDGFAGDADDGTAVEPVEPAPVPPGLAPLDFTIFLDQTRARLDAVQKPPQPIVSAVLGDFSGLPFDRGDGPILDPGEIFEPPVEPTEPFPPAPTPEDTTPPAGS